MTKYTKMLALATLCTFIIMAFAGLKPKGFRFHNTVAWLSDKDGISFGNTGIAYTDKNQNVPCKMPESLSIELAINFPQQRWSHLSLIFDLWDDQSHRHLTLCQWDSTLMVVKSCSKTFTDNKLKLCKSVSPEKPCFVSITSCRNRGTDFYVNGVHVGSTDIFDLCDSTASLGRLVLGNSPTANNPWQGEVYAFSIFAKAFNEKEIQGRYQQWQVRHSMPDTEALIALYTFEEKNNEIAHDKGGKLGDLHIPVVFFIPQKQVLTIPWEDFKLNKSYAGDVAINLAGFIPFGLLFSAFLWSIGGVARRHRLIISILVGGSISLFFELAQVYIPTRNSQMSDLILNIFGTLVGAFTISIFLYYSRNDHTTNNQP
jgi:hypothetical protein